MGLQSSKMNVKYGSECHRIDSEFNFSIVYLFVSVFMFLLSCCLYFIKFPLFYIPIILGIILSITYLWNVYSKHKRITNSEKIECKEDYRKISIWY